MSCISICFHGNAVFGGWQPACSVPGKLYREKSLINFQWKTTAFTHRKPHWERCDLKMTVAKKQTRRTRGGVDSCSIQFPFGKVDARRFPSLGSFPEWATNTSMAAQLLLGPFAKQLEFLDLEVFQRSSHTCVWNVFSTFDPSPEEQQRCHIQESSGWSNAPTTCAPRGWVATTEALASIFMVFGMTRPWRTL